MKHETCFVDIVLLLFAMDNKGELIHEGKQFCLINLVSSFFYFLDSYIEGEKDGTWYRYSINSVTFSFWIPLPLPFTRLRWVIVLTLGDLFSLPLWVGTYQRLWWFTDRRIVICCGSRACYIFLGVYCPLIWTIVIAFKTKFIPRYSVISGSSREQWFVRHK